MNYDAADKAVKAMNRENLKTFGQMKTRLMKADELNIIREVTSAYDAIMRLAKKRLYEIARLAYMDAMAEAGKRHRNDIDLEWLLLWMEETDPVTLYKFFPEWERKKARLIEALPVAPDRGKEIDKALKSWARQIGQASISITDSATLEAYEDAGVLEVEWVSERDDRVCGECNDLDGNIYPIDAVPAKPHWGCRCRLKIHKVSGGKTA